MIPTETIRTPAFSMEYFRFGEGEKPFVILPGLSVQSVMPLADAVAAEYAPLTKDYAVYVFDRRKELPAAYSVEEMAEDTAAAMKALGLSDVILFGASQGGMMAQVIAIRHPELVRSVILGSMCAHVTEEQYRGIGHWAELAQKGDRIGLYLDFGEKIYPPAVFAQYRDALCAAAETVTEEELARFVILAEGTRGFDTREELSLIDCPVFVIGAKDDAVLGSDAAGEFAEKLGDRSDFRLYVYDGFGHAAFDTAPDYRERMLGFLKEMEEA